MPDHRATVTCPTCGFEADFDKLGPARLAIDQHREETGHEAQWELSRLAPGVERAGDLATTCDKCNW
jgi:hypothetical protein